MSYVTQGKVQVELKTADNKNIYIWIHPVQGYAVKHEKEDRIVFIDDGPENQPLDAIVFKTTQIFSADKDLAQPLAHAAFKQIVIEIKIKERPISSSPPGSDPIEIESIRIPGTFGSDKA